MAALRGSHMLKVSPSLPARVPVEMGCPESHRRLGTRRQAPRFSTYLCKTCACLYERPVERTPRRAFCLRKV